MDINQVVPEQVDFTQFGIDARALLYGYLAADEADELVTYGDPASVPSVDQQIDELNDYVPSGVLDTEDIALLREFTEFNKSFTVQPDESTRSVRLRYRQWMADRNINSTNHRILYHAFRAAEEILFVTQMTAHLADKPEAEDAKSRDGRYCVISGTFCTKRSDGGRFAGIVRTVVGGGIAVIFRQSVNWTSADEVLGLVNLGNLAESAAGVAAGAILISYWDDIFCKAKCDNCAHAIGAVPVFNDVSCEFLGIRLIGNFEFAETFEIFIDEERDGIFSGPYTRFRPDDPFISAQQMGNLSAGTFNFRVDVTCDGNVEFRWAGPAEGLFFDLNDVRRPRPTASVTPPRKSNFHYFSFTPLSFTTFAVTTRGWTFNSWLAFGGTPDSGGSLSRFTTTFNDSSPIPRGVDLSWSHPCEPDYRTFGAGFLVCPTENCR